LLDEPETKVNGNRGQISEKELYSVKLEDEDTELEAALARSRRSAFVLSFILSYLDFLMIYELICY